jgi:LPS sulfotransferase NodH
MCHSLNAAAVAGKPVEFFEPRQAQSDGVAAMELALEVVRPGVAPNEEK